MEAQKAVDYYASLKGVQQRERSQKSEGATTAPTSERKAQKPKKADGEAASKHGKKAASKQGGAGEQKVTFDVKKNEDFALWFEQICVLAELIDKRYPVKGMPVFRPYGYYMHSSIMRLVEHQWESMGTQLVQFPALIPYSFLAKEQEHIKGFEAECFWITRAGLNELQKEEWLALRPTSETAMYHMFSKWIRSYRDLPLQIHQTCAVYRHETKDTRPLIRIREIYWNEAHTCHASAQEALQHLEDVWMGYFRVIRDQLGFTGVRLRRPDWDRFAGAEHTDVLDSVMPCGRVLQTVGAHYLGQKFAKVFDIEFLNKQQQKELGFMTCYGVSTRLLAACVSAHGDDRGLVLPSAIAQVQVVIVPLLKKGEVSYADSAALKVATDVAATLKQNGIRVFIDDSEQKPAPKYYHWEMRGVPVRIEIGEKDMEKNVVTLVRRDMEGRDAKQAVAMDNVVKSVQDTFRIQLDGMRARAAAYLQDHITDCSTIEEVAAAMKKGGFARVPFVSMRHDGKEAEAPIREGTGGEVRGYSPTEAPPAEGVKCIATGKQATVWAYVARAY